MTLSMLPSTEGDLGLDVKRRTTIWIPTLTTRLITDTERSTMSMSRRRPLHLPLHGGVNVGDLPMPKPGPINKLNVTMWIKGLVDSLLSRTKASTVASEATKQRDASQTSHEPTKHAVQRYKTVRAPPSPPPSEPLNRMNLFHHYHLTRGRNSFQKIQRRPLLMAGHQNLLIRSDGLQDGQMS